ncbi:MAG: ribosome maturation factor RimP [Desulfobulbus propionicus]|nr:MAG: ribosome maturation factor RimP [Desulfobulbus propionicus]
MTDITENIQALTEPLLEDMGLELVEIQFRRERQGWVLRFFIDSKEGVTLDDCVSVSREISTCLEVEDCIDHAYRLEVSSPGAERPLKCEKDYMRFAGKKARIRMRDPVEGQGEQKVFVGILQGVDEGSVLLEQEGHTFSLQLNNIAKARLAL